MDIWELDKLNIEFKDNSNKELSDNSVYGNLSGRYQRGTEKSNLCSVKTGKCK